MPLSNKIEAYEDIKVILDAVLAQGGGSYILPSAKEAHKFRFRAYKFRNLATAQGIGKYNALILRLQGDTITFDQASITGLLFDPDGTPVNPLNPLPVDDDYELIE